MFEENEKELVDYSLRIFHFANEIQCRFVGLWFASRLFIRLIENFYLQYIKKKKVNCWVQIEYDKSKTEICWTDCHKMASRVLTNKSISQIENDFFFFFAKNNNIAQHNVREKNRFTG